MKNCGKRFHNEVGKFRFLNELIKVVSPKVGRPTVLLCLLIEDSSYVCAANVKKCAYFMSVPGLTLTRACKKEGSGVDL